MTEATEQHTAAGASAANGDEGEPWSRFPRRVHALRRHLNLSETEMALRLGMSLRPYRRIERGERKHLNCFVLWQFHEATGVSPDWLLTGCWPCFARATRNDDLPRLVGGALMPPGGGATGEARP